MKLRMLFLSILFISFATQGFSQDFSKLENFPLKEKADFSNAEKQVLECANYLVSKPLDINDENRDFAERFLFAWMTGSPDYTFNIDEKVGKIVELNNSLLGIYLGYATKIALEDKEKSLNGIQLTNKAISMLLDYCKNPDNKVAINESLKKIIDENNGASYQKL